MFRYRSRVALACAPLSPSALAAKRARLKNRQTDWQAYLGLALILLGVALWFSVSYSDFAVLVIPVAVMLALVVLGAIQALQLIYVALNNLEPMTEGQHPLVERSRDVRGVADYLAQVRALCRSLTRAEASAIIAYSRDARRADRVRRPGKATTCPEQLDR